MLNNDVQLLSQLLGWGYTIAWSASFYGQVLLNYRRKSVSGLSMDFTTLNLIGFACYATYASNFYFNPSVREQYRQRHNGQNNSVTLNDVAFAAHAFSMAAIIYAQTWYYPRERGQRMSAFNRTVVAFFLFFISVDLGLLLLGFEKGIDFLYHLSYIKLYITFSKYIPQAYLNFKRKSTQGWSILNILLDFTGGWLSLMQLLLDASQGGDWSAVTGNPAKFGLSMLTFFFDMLFIIQHYVLYADDDDKPSRKSSEDEDEGVYSSKEPSETTALLSHPRIDA